MPESDTTEPARILSDIQLQAMTELAMTRRGR